MSEYADQIVDIYRRHARAWTTAREAADFVEAPWIERFLALLPPGSAILDLGCGSGVPIGRHLAGQGHALTGVDSAPEMVSLFQTHLPDHSAQVCDMRRLTLASSFDGVIAWDSFFHLSHQDQRMMFGTFQTHTHPGAALMFTSGPAFGEAIGSLEGEPLYHSSLDGEEYRRLLAANRFEPVAQVNEDPQCGGRTVWLARRW